MKLGWISYGFAVGIAVSVVTSSALCQDDPDRGAEQNMMRLWQKYALPSEYHDLLEFFVGEWEVTTKIWWEGPDEPPIESQATIWSKLMYGGRFVETQMKGTMYLEIDGQMMPIPIRARGYTGYDNFKEKFIAVWIDSNGTGIYYSEGTVDKTGKVFTYFGTTDEWESGRRDVPFKMVDTIVDENTCVSEMYDLTTGPTQTRIFKMTARRKIEGEPQDDKKQDKGRDSAG